jgi:hypothetical protein
MLSLKCRAGRKDVPYGWMFRGLVGGTALLAKGALIQEQLARGPFRPNICQAVADSGGGQARWLDSNEKPYAISIENPKLLLDFEQNFSIIGAAHTLFTSRLTASGGK